MRRKPSLPSLYTFNQRTFTHRAFSDVPRDARTAAAINGWN